MSPGNPLPPPPRSTSSWIERVREADAEAEEAWQLISEPVGQWLADSEMKMARALVVIAAELRAARIARRPGAGQT